MVSPKRQWDSPFVSLPDSCPAAPEPRFWTPHRIGPRFAWLDHNHILVIDGPLSERKFQLATDVQRDKAAIWLRENGSFVGRAQIERSPPGGEGIILSNVAVGQRFRRSGLAAIMIWCVFRELLEMQESATFRIRMPRAVKPGTAVSEVQNVGISVIAARLGFGPELPVEEIVHADNIAGIAALPGDLDHPPALKILLRSYPFVLIALLLSRGTMRPLSDYRTYLQLKHDGDRIQDWLRRGLLFVSSNYCLRESGIRRFVNALATDEDEAVLFNCRVRGL
jgi:hypothetical protein